MNEFEKNIPEVPSDGYTPEISLNEPEEITSVPEPEEVEQPSEAPESQMEPEEAPETEEIPEEPLEESLEEPDEVPPSIETAPSMAARAIASEQTKQESKLKKAWREKKLFIILSTVFLLLAIAVISVVSYVYFVINPFASYDKIMPNVYCAGVNLGGMTVEEAQGAIEEALRSPSYTIKLILPDGEYTFAPAQEGITLNGEAVAQQAYQYGRGDQSAYGMYKAYHAAEAAEYRLDAETDLSFSQEDVEALVNTIYEETYIAPTETTISGDDEKHVASLVLGEPGREIDKDALYERICKGFEDMNFNDVEWGYEKVEIDTSTFRKLIRDLSDTLEHDPVDPVITADHENHNIVVQMGTQGWELDGNELYKLAIESVEKEEYVTVSLELTAIDPELVDITPAYEELVCDPTEPYYSQGQVLEGSNGYTLDWEPAIQSIYDSSWGETVTIAMTAIPPEKTAEQVRAVLFRDQLASFSSPHEANSNRTNNLRLACKAINGTVLNAGETFSFNSVVGQRTAAKGYKEATVYVGNDSVGEIGGGICQVASTIYNAALYAQMEITNRAPHTFFVTYVKGGLDATVYWGSQDFCFRNSSEYPVRINAWVADGRVYVTIDGTNVDGSYVTLSSTQLSSTPYTTKYIDDDTKPVGYEEVKVTAYTGYVYEAYQYIYNSDGSLRQTNYLGKSTYKKRDREVIRGTYTAPVVTPTPAEPTTPDTATSTDTTPAEGGTES